MREYYFTNVPKPMYETPNVDFWIWKHSDYKNGDFKVLVIDNNKIIAEGKSGHLLVDFNNVIYVD